MLFSALTLAAMLQAAPVAVPEAAPVPGRKGYLLQQQPYDPSQRVDQLRLPAPKARKMTPDEARAASERGKLMRPPVKAKPWAKTQSASLSLGAKPCRKDGFERAGHPETMTVQPLGKLPPAHLEYALARTVDGCPVAVLVAQNGPAR